MILWLNYDSRVCHRYMPDGHVRRIQYLYFFFFFNNKKPQQSRFCQKPQAALFGHQSTSCSRFIGAAGQEHNCGWMKILKLTIYDWVRELWDRTQARSCYLYWAEWLSSTSGSLSWGDTFTKQQIVLSVWRKRNPSSLGVSNEAMEGVAGGDACQVMRIMEKDKP